MSTFLYGCLGALLPDLLILLRSRRDIANGLPTKKTVLATALVTLSWIIAAGFFATALPGDVAKLTAVYAGISLPITVTRVSKGLSEPIEVDSIELRSEPRFSDVLRHVFFSG